MENVIFITKSNFEGLEIEYAVINHGNDEFTSMLKSTYDAMQAEQSTPNLAD
jgi:hypothetical protein